MSFFIVAVAALWRYRNRLVFANESKMGDDLWYQICAQVSDIEREKGNPLNSTNVNRVKVDVCWKPPPHSSFKVNIDGAHNQCY